MIGKTTAGALVAGLLPLCRFEHTIFILGHMRCGSTALSHILCQHPMVSGYGEAHIRYDRPAALGVLALNQLRRRALRLDARHMFDKILHSRYDDNPHPGFYEAKAIFLLRPPDEAIRSIRHLFDHHRTQEYASDAAAADYYEARLTMLARHWERFAPDRRLGLTHKSLTEDPDTALARISALLGFATALSNSYNLAEHGLAHGAGDPLSAHRFNSIVPAGRSTTLREQGRPLQISDNRMSGLQQLYYDFVKQFTIL